MIREMRVGEYLCGAEALPETIVQFSRDAAALFVLGLQKLDAEPARLLLLAGAIVKLLREPSIVFPDQKDGQKERCDEHDYRDAKEFLGQCSPLSEQDFLGPIDLGDNCGSLGRPFDDLGAQFGLRGV